jgi:hypothetical protein
MGSSVGNLLRRRVDGRKPVQTVGGLAEAEQALHDAVTSGTLIDLRCGDPTVDAPAKGGDWGDDRTIRAEILATLLTEAHPTWRPRALRLAGAKLVGVLDLEARELLCSLLLRNCWMAEPINLGDTVAPTIRLPGCQVPGLHAARLVTRGNLELSQGFTAHGPVDLSSAHIGGTLQLTDATLANPNGRARNAPRLTVEENLFGRQGFTASGDIHLLGAHINGALDLTGATFTNPTGTVLNLEGLQAVVLILQPRTAPASINLIGAHVEVLADDQATWPGELRLRGFSYQRLTEPPEIPTRARLDWLARDPNGYRPGPYEQLAEAFRRAGHEPEARRVLIAKQRHRRTRLSFPARVWSWLLDWLVGYGYRTWQAALWLVGVLIASSVAISAAYPQQFTAATPSRPVPDFQPVMYALDALLPVVDLYQQAAWIPQGWVRWVVWSAVLAGWILTTAVVAALTGLLKRD